MGSSSQQPGHTSLGGRRVLPRRWSLLKESPRAAAASYGPCTPVWGDAEPCPGAGWCSRRACGASSSQVPGHTSLGRRGVPSRQCPVRKEGPRGTYWARLFVPFFYRSPIAAW